MIYHVSTSAKCHFRHLVITRQKIGSLMNSMGHTKLDTHRVYLITILGLLKLQCHATI